MHEYINQVSAGRITCSKQQLSKENSFLRKYLKHKAAIKRQSYNKCLPSLLELWLGLGYHVQKFRILVCWLSVWNDPPLAGTMITTWGLHLNISKRSGYIAICNLSCANRFFTPFLLILTPEQYPQPESYNDYWLNPKYLPEALRLLIPFCNFRAFGILQVVDIYIIFDKICLTIRPQR